MLTSDNQKIDITLSLTVGSGDIMKKAGFAEMQSWLFLFSGDGSHPGQIKIWPCCRINYSRTTNNLGKDWPLFCDIALKRIWGNSKVGVDMHAVKLTASYEAMACF
jgi:hypothetical protein